jgi:hypothetical protein
MAHTRKRQPPAPEPQPNTPATGPERYTGARFLSNCAPDSEEWLREQWTEGNQLRSEQIPVDALPPVLILACYAREYGVELTDDYDLLLSRYDDNIASVFHPDKFFASSISLLAGRGQVPSDEAFESIHIPTIYEELLP